MESVGSKNSNNGRILHSSDQNRILNSRPLTYKGDELEDLDRLISPANFLVGHRKLGVPMRADTAADVETDADPDFLPREIPLEMVLKLLKHQDRVLDHFWKLWHMDYLNSSRSRSHNFHRHPRMGPCAIRILCDF